MSFRVTVELVVMICPTCGIVYGLTESYQDRKYKEAGSWFCPNGHGVCYPRESDEKRIARLEAEKIALNARVNSVLEQRNAAETLAKSFQDRNKRLRKRVANGVCPCCNRHFVNLERHMKSKHPQKVA